MNDPEEFPYVMEVLERLRLKFEDIGSPDKVRGILNPAIATTLAAELQANASSLTEPMSFYQAAIGELEYKIRTREEDTYIDERFKKDDQGKSVNSVDDAKIKASQQTRDEQKDLLRMKNIVNRLKNYLDQASRLASVLQSHATALKNERSI